MRSEKDYDAILTSLIEEALKETNLSFERAKEIVGQLSGEAQKELLAYLLMQGLGYEG